MSDSILPLFFTLTALTAALIVAWLGIRFLTGLGGRRAPEEPIRLRTSLALGSRSKLVVVSYRGTEYLLGMTATEIRLLDSGMGAQVAPDTDREKARHPPATTHDEQA